MENSNNFISPLTKRPCSQIVQKIPVKDIEKLYNSRKKISVLDEFEGDYIYLVREEDIGFEFFYPFKAGSVQFYKDFYRDVDYQQAKQEYDFASKYIDANNRVLDVGCGAGVFAKYIPQAKFIGLELTKTSVEKAQKKGLEVYHQTLEEYYHNDQQKFDVVTSFQVLEHVYDPMEFVKNCLKQLKEEGILILSVPNNDGYKYLEVNSHTNIPPHHISRWSLKTFLFLAKELNLDLVDYYYDSDSLKNYLRFGFLNKFLRYSKGKRLIVNGSLCVRSLDFILNVIFHLLKPLFKFDFPAITGHSLTVVMKKSKVR